MALIYDLVDLAELTGYAREIMMETERNPLMLSPFLPTRFTMEIELTAAVGTLLDESEAQIRAWDSESPIVGRQGAAKTKFEIPPVSRKSKVGEYERLKALSLSGARGDNAAVINAIYDDAARHARSIAARWARLRADALFDAAITLTQTYDRVIQTVSYGRSGSHAVTAAVLWTAGNKATSVPIQDLIAWHEVYIGTNGAPAGAILMSSAALAGALVSDSVKTALALPVGGPPTTPAALSALLGAYWLPPIITNDVQTRRSDGTKTRLTPSNKILFLPTLGEETSNLGGFFVGPTAESLELAGAQAIAGEDAPGLASVVDKTSDPVGVWTKVAGVGFPWVANPNLTLLATVQ